MVRSELSDKAITSIIAVKYLAHNGEFTLTDVFQHFASIAFFNLHNNRVSVCLHISVDHSFTGQFVLIICIYFYPLSVKIRIPE